MTRDTYNTIINMLRLIVSGTMWENHVYAVGGCVRDIAMGLEPKDIDIVVDLPNGGVDFAQWLVDNKHAKKTVAYTNYGTAKVRLADIDDIELDCCMTRGEKYTDKNTRNPITAFAPINEDAIRRDLTINAMYHNVSTDEIYDPTGGMEDIKKHILRTTNADPNVVFDDDPLRILRVIRFYARFGWLVDGNTYKAMKAHADRLKIISTERVRDEFVKILMSTYGADGVRMLLYEIGAMRYIIPELELCVGMTQNAYHSGDVAEHTLSVLQWDCGNYEPNVVSRMAALLHDIGKVNARTVGADGRVHFYDHEFIGSKMCEYIMRRLCFDNKTIDKVAFLVKNHMRTKSAGDDCAKMKDKTFNKLTYECGDMQTFEMLARLIECDNMSHAKEHCIRGQYVSLVSTARDHNMFGYKLPVNGNDVCNILGIAPSSSVKDILDILIKRAFSKPEVTRDECIAIIKGTKIKNN